MIVDPYLASEATETRKVVRLMTSLRDNSFVSADNTTSHFLDTKKVCNNEMRFRSTTPKLF